ncbi:MAG: hypothetical protein ACOYN6_00290 [Ignavibacteria bacterium]
MRNLTKIASVSIKVLLGFVIFAVFFSCKESHKNELKTNESVNEIKQPDKIQNEVGQQNKSTGKKDSKIKWVGTYVFEDQSSIVKLTVKPNNLVYFETGDIYGSIFKYECYSVLKDNSIEIYFKKVIYDNLKQIEMTTEPLYILSYDNDILYTQTQFDTDGLKRKSVYFNKRK